MEARKMAKSKKAKKHLLKLAVVGAISCAVAACSSGPGVMYPLTDEGVASKPPKVTSKIVSETMSAGDGFAGLAPGELAKLDNFAMRFIENGSGYFTIIVPEANDRVIAEANAKQIHAYSRKAGLRAEELDIRIANLNDQSGPVVMSYEAYSVKLRTCGKHLPNPSYNPENRMSPDFGCSIANNIALMVSNPADLVVGRNRTQSPATTSSAELDALRQGKSPANYSLNTDL
jgi:pilus assembly protein CpaD